VLLYLIFLFDLRFSIFGLPALPAKVL
jgi:hypothetical protein